MAIFRFLINVDKCLDMSHYKCFFYKLKSRASGGQRLFHLSEAQLLDGDPLSLRRAVTDIRMYLDKYPYEVDDYRIIFATRQAYAGKPTAWEETVLYRLLRLRYEFLQSRILLSSAVEAGRDNALNFVMLYDADFSADLPRLTPYFSSKRLAEDLALLLQQYGIDENGGTTEQLGAALDATLLSKKKKADTSLVGGPDAYRAPHEADFLLRYLSAVHDEEELPEASGSLCDLLATFTKDLLCNYRVYERFINRSDRRAETLAFLRLTDFINHDTEAQGGHAAHTTLAHRCDDAWEQVWNDPDTATRYATTLANYSARLEHAERDLENLTFPIGINTELPQEAIPASDAIASKEGAFSEESEEKKRREDVLTKLDIYAKKRLFLRSFREDWDNTYREIVYVLNNLKDSLRIYAQDLSHQYADVLAERKRESLVWKSANYAVTAAAQERLEIIEEKKEEHLKRLKEPHMNPALSFQDVLNSERELEQAGKNISFYLDCLRATTLLNFLLMLLVCGGLFVLHYTVLQPYALQGADTFIYYLVYVALSLVLMGTAIGMPYRYYTKRAKNCIGKLRSELAKYIDGYSARAEYFSQYINHINCLDYLTRYSELLSHALERGRDLNRGQLWHRDQIKRHLEMLNHFSGLIESAPPALEPPTASAVSVITNERICDVVDCSIYWP